MESHNASRPWRYQPCITSTNGCSESVKILRLTAVPYLFTYPQPDVTSPEPTTDCEEIIVESTEQRKSVTLENTRQKDVAGNRVKKPRGENKEYGGHSLLASLKEDWLPSVRGEKKRADFSSAQVIEDDQLPHPEFSITIDDDVTECIDSSQHEVIPSVSTHKKDDLFTVKWHNKTRVKKQKRLRAVDITQRRSLARGPLTRSRQKKLVFSGHEDVGNKLTSFSEGRGSLVDKEDTDSVTSDDPDFIDPDDPNDPDFIDPDDPNDPDFIDPDDPNDPDFIDPDDPDNSSDLENPDDPDPVVMSDKETFNKFPQDGSLSSSKDTTLNAAFKWMPEVLQTFITRSNKLRIAHVTASSVMVVNPAFYVDEEKKNMDFDGDTVLRPVFAIINESCVKMIVLGKLFEEVDIGNIQASIDILKKVENKFIQNQYIFCPGVSETYIKACQAVGIKVPLHTFDKYFYCGRVSYHDKICEKFYRKSNSVSMSKIQGYAYTCRCCNHKIYYYRARYRRRKLGVINVKVLKTLPSPNLSKKVFPRYRYSQNSSLSGHLRRRSMRHTDVDLIKLSENMKERFFTLNSKQNKDFLEVLTTLKNDKLFLEIFKRDSSEAVNARKWAALYVWDGEVKKATYVRDRLLADETEAYNNCNQLNDHSSEIAKDTCMRYKNEICNRWSMVTFRIALAIYLRNNESYKSIESFRILDLPSLHPLNEYNFEVENQSKTHLEYISEQSKKYFALSKEYKAEGLPPCLAEGALIIDQMKIISNAVWYGIHESLNGHDLSQEELLSLCDIFNASAEVKTPRPDGYVLQTVWRDMCYEHDIIGPHFHLSQDVKGPQLASYLLWTIKSFNDFGLKTIAVVCDYAAINGACVRGSLGEGSPLGVRSDEFSEINPTFTNPFDPSIKISWIVCPNHMLINVINALHSSQPEGSKDFQYGGISFGWKALEFLLENDIERKKKNEPRIAPLLRKSYIERRHTIKFQYALFPSRILQVLDALEKETKQTVHEDLKPMMEKTWEFLTASNKIFEKGLLSNSGVTATDEEAISNMVEGYHWFCEWQKQAHTATDFQVRNPRQKEFLSWQTWDGLQLSVHGFKSLCKNFHSRHPDRAIVPIRLNGIAVEDIFSLVRHHCGTGRGKAKVSALSYPVGLSEVKFHRKLKRKHKRYDIVQRSCKELKMS
ncbi:Latent membrane protein 1-like [Homarus americanus]|uniref:Latent membrane protein 1-like n=1 Tax=Homarus americanus TaxID=6706 RepID=A0A8J5MRY9_HOMAM|nr:Latent membrane protein 1-like [Homarus americanus]